MRTQTRAFRGSLNEYSALHQWVRYHLGTPKYCEHCGSTSSKFYDWANKSHEYNRDLNDWIRLCRSCHSKYDSNGLCALGLHPMTDGNLYVNSSGVRFCKSCKQAYRQDYYKNKELRSPESVKRYEAHKISRKLPTGVFKNKSNKRYQSRIAINKEKIYLGSFDSIEEAQYAYLKAKESR